MKRIFILFILITLLGCNNKGPYFQFDRVEYYRVNEANGLLDSVIKKEHPTNDEKILLQLFYNKRYPADIKEVYNLDWVNIGYLKQNTTSDNLDSLREIFRTHNTDNMGEVECPAEFRDILIFKNKNEITGFAKICFSCNHHYILGSKYNTDNFGQSGEFAKLERILLGK